MSTASSSESLALIAGSTQMPRVVAAEAQAQGLKVIAIAIEGVTEPAIGEVVDQVHWLEWVMLVGSSVCSGSSAPGALHRR